MRALEKLPAYIKKEQENIAEFQKDMPVLQELVNGTWSKESRLSELKTELAAVERKIQLSIEPVKQSEEPAEQAEKAGKSKGFRKYYQNERRSFATRRTVSTNGVLKKRGSASPRFFIKFRLLIFFLLVHPFYQCITQTVKEFRSVYLSVLSSIKV